MELKELMKKFGEETGLTKLVPDADGVYRLEIDERAVSLAEIDSGRRLVTWSSVGELPPDGRETFYRLLLEEMFMARGTAGSSFALEPDNDTLFLQRTDALEAMDYEGFKAMFETFVNVGDHWEKLVADFSPLASELTKEKDAAQDEITRLGASDFMQV